MVRTTPTSIYTSTGKDNNTGGASGTFVIAAVTLMIGQPTSQSLSSFTANENNTNNCNRNNSAGDIIVTISSSSLSNNSRGQNYNINSTTDLPCVQSFIQRIVNNPSIINLQQLCIIPNQSAFRLVVHVTVIQNDGNLLDMCLLAAIMALTDTDIPTVESLRIENYGKVYIPDCNPYFDDEEEKQQPSIYKKFQMPIVPIALTAGMTVTSSSSEQEHEIETTRHHEDKHQKNNKKRYWIVDPTYEEEIAFYGSFTTIVVDGAAAFAKSTSSSYTHNNTVVNLEMDCDDDDDDKSILAIDMTASPSISSDVLESSLIPLSMTDVALLMKIASAHAKTVYLNCTR